MVIILEDIQGNLFFDVGTITSYSAITYDAFVI